MLFHPYCLRALSAACIVASSLVGSEYTNICFACVSTPQFSPGTSQLEMVTLSVTSA